MNSNQKFMTEISHLRPIEFAGLARLLGVSIVTTNDPAAENVETETKSDTVVPRSFADVLGDIMVKFNTLNRQRKREILKLVKKAAAENRGGFVGSNTENT